MTANLNDVLSQATKKIAALIQKSFSKSGMSNKGGKASEDLESLLRNADFE